MNNQHRLLIVLGVFAVIAGSFILYASWPLLTGTEVVLKTRPVDPFDPLRGQYMIINYEINTVPAIPDVQEGDIIYVSLQQDGDTWNAAGANTEKPSGVFIRGTITEVYGSEMRVRYGIEQFFFERNADVPTRDITVKVKVSSNGGARLVELLQNGTPVNITYQPVNLES